MLKQDYKIVLEGLKEGTALFIKKFQDTAKYRSIREIRGSKDISKDYGSRIVLVGDDIVILHIFDHLAESRANCQAPKITAGEVDGAFLMIDYTEHRDRIKKLKLEFDQTHPGNFPTILLINNWDAVDDTDRMGTNFYNSFCPANGFHTWFGISSKSDDKIKLALVLMATICHGGTIEKKPTTPAPVVPFENGFSKASPQGVLPSASIVPFVNGFSKASLQGILPSPSVVLPSLSVVLPSAPEPFSKTKYSELLYDILTDIINTLGTSKNYETFITDLMSYFGLMYICQKNIREAMKDDKIFATILDEMQGLSMNHELTDKEKTNKIMLLVIKNRAHL
jgi:hypothetical protein